MAYFLGHPVEGYCSSLRIKKHSFWIVDRHPSSRNPPLTVIKMVHITITSFHINWYADKSYLIGLDFDPVGDSIDTL